MTRIVVAALAALALTACGGESAGDVLQETAANLSEIRSGELDLELLFTAEEEGRTGFALAGPFSLDAEPLVAGRLDYTQTVGAESETVTFVSTGQKAFVEVRGTAYELPPETAAEFRAATGGLKAGGLEELDLGGWVDDPELEDGRVVGGTETDLIRARLDVVEVVNTLLQLSAALSGGATQSLEGEDAQHLARAVESSSVEIHTGKDDRLLRRLEIAIDFRPADAPAQLRELVGAGVRFRLALARVNEPVTVEAPAAPRPYSELGLG